MFPAYTKPPSRPRTADVRRPSTASRRISSTTTRMTAAEDNPTRGAALAQPSSRPTITTTPREPPRCLDQEEAELLSPPAHRERALAALRTEALLRQGSAFLHAGDAAAALRCYRICEPAVHALTVVGTQPFSSPLGDVLSWSGGGASGNEWRLRTCVSACKYYVNFGVAAACCGDGNLAARAFSSAEASAQRLLTDHGNAGAGGTASRFGKSLCDAIAFNRRLVQRFTGPAASHQNEFLVERSSWSSLGFMREFYVFLFETDDDAADRSTTVLQPRAAAASESGAPRHVDALQSNTESLEVTPAPTVLATSSLSTPLTSADVNVLLDSLISNARAQHRLDVLSQRESKLRIIVSRDGLVNELGWYFRDMSSHSLRRPLDMCIKGESAIDGGRGGVTNEVLSAFFERTSQELLLVNAASDEHNDGVTTENEGSSSIPGATNATRNAFPASDVWFAFGVLLVKSFVENRCFSSLHAVVHCPAWTPLFFPDDTVTADGIPVVDSHPSEAEAVVDQCHRSLVAHLLSLFLRSCVVADLHNQVPSRLAEFWCSDALLRCLRSSLVGGEAYVRGLPHLLLESSGSCPEDLLLFLPQTAAWRVPVDARLASLREAGRDVAAACQHIFLWYLVVGSKLDALLQIRRGMEFSRELILDLSLRECLFPSARDGELASSSSTTTHVRTLLPLLPAVCARFRATVGGDELLQSNVSGISAKALVSRLEFRGWAQQTGRTPYYLCSWLHHGASAEQRRAFLYLCTALTALPQLLGHADATQNPQSDKIVVIKSPTNLFYAKTCFYTLYVPESWDLCAQDDVWAFLGAAVGAVQSDPTMDEVDTAADAAAVNGRVAAVDNV